MKVPLGLSSFVRFVNVTCFQYHIIDIVSAPLFLFSSLSESKAHHKRRIRLPKTWFSVHIAFNTGVCFQQPGFDFDR